MKSVSSIQMTLPTGPTTESEVVGPVGFIHLYSSKLDFVYSLRQVHFVRELAFYCGIIKFCRDANAVFLAEGLFERFCHKTVNILFLLCRKSGFEIEEMLL